MGMGTENRCRLELISLTTADAVAAAGEDIIQLKPDVGFLYEVIGLMARIPDPVGSGAGDHQLEIFRNGREHANDEYITITSNTGVDIVIRDSVGFQGTTEAPSATAQQYDMMHSVMWASNANPLDFKYDNDTDVEQSGTRNIMVYVKKWREAI